MKSKTKKRLKKVGWIALGCLIWLKGGQIFIVEHEWVGLLIGMCGVYVAVSAYYLGKQR